MKRFTKIALGALLLAGATTAVAAPTSARVFVGVGAPYAYAPGPVCDPYAPYYNPYYCGYGPTIWVGPNSGLALVAAGAAEASMVVDSTAWRP